MPGIPSGRKYWPQRGTSLAGTTLNAYDAPKIHPATFAHPSVVLSHVGEVVRVNLGHPNPHATLSSNPSAAEQEKRQVSTPSKACKGSTVGNIEQYCVAVGNCFSEVALGSDDGLPKPLWSSWLIGDSPL